MTTFIKIKGNIWINTINIKTISIEKWTENEYRVFIYDNEISYNIDNFPTQEEALECVESIINRCI
jgi:hypothetical protein